MKKLLITGLVLTCIAFIGGVSCGSEPEKEEPTVKLSGVHTSLRNESYGVGDGYIVGDIENLSDEVRDYEISVQRWSPKYGYGSDSESTFQETVGKFNVKQVRPGEKKSWECVLFEQRGFKNLDWDWVVCVDGEHCWRY